MYANIGIHKRLLRNPARDITRPVENPANGFFFSYHFGACARRSEQKTFVYFDIISLAYITMCVHKFLIGYNVLSVDN
jgi:hypothetical protein